jgi:hypothetical protein
VTLTWSCASEVAESRPKKVIDRGHVLSLGLLAERHRISSNYAVHVLSLTLILLHRSIHLVRLSISIVTRVLFVYKADGPSFNEHSYEVQSRSAFSSSLRYRHLDSSHLHRTIHIPGVLLRALIVTILNRTTASKSFLYCTHKYSPILILYCFYRKAFPDISNNRVAP